MKTWQIRYSSCEMLYLDITERGVHAYLDHSPHKGDRWSFEEVLSGAADYAIRVDFGSEILEELKAELRTRQR